MGELGEKQQITLLTVYIFGTYYGVLHEILTAQPLSALVALLPTLFKSTLRHCNHGTGRHAESPASGSVEFGVSKWLKLTQFDLFSSLDFLTSSLDYKSNYGMRNLQEVRRSKNRFPSFLCRSACFPFSFFRD